MYEPTLQGTVDEFGEPVRWVEGPNRQFEKMMRFVMDTIPNGIVFMKEFDTKARKDNHFGNLLEDVESQQPFMVLGSQYEGNKWDGFRDQMDVNLLTHLNGNAIYNVSHQCFRSILERMEGENSGTEAFDVAMRRIVRTDFSEECEELYKQTSVIDNLAATLVHEGEINHNASYIHGAKVMNPIDESITITAIVSNFAGKNSSETVQALVAGKHSFSDVIMVEDHGMPGSSSNFTEVQIGGGSSTIRIKNITRYPGVSPSRDFCLALSHIATPYFTSTNVFRKPTNTKPIMNNDDNDKKFGSKNHRGSRGSRWRHGPQAPQGVLKGAYS